MLIASKATIIFDIDFCAFDEGIGLADGICSTLSLVNLIEGLNDEEVLNYSVPKALQS